MPLLNVYCKCTYLNLTSLHRASIAVAPPNECPITAILHRSMEFCWPKRQEERSDTEFLFGLASAT